MVNYCGTNFEIVGQNAKEAVLILPGEKVCTAYVGGMLGTKRKRIELNTIKVRISSLKPVEKEDDK